MSDPQVSPAVGASNQNTADCSPANGCEDCRSTCTSQNSDVPSPECSIKGEQDTSSCPSCSYNQSCQNLNVMNQSSSILQKSDSEGDQSEYVCSSTEKVNGRGSYAAKKPLSLSVNVHEPPDEEVELLPTPVQRRGNPLSREDFTKLFDQDGRLVDEHAFRKSIFMGGVEPEIRKEAWQFLFGLYPCTSTSREREELLLDYIMKYHELKSHWKTILVLNAHPGATLLQQGLVAR